jgi:hypothetical protein
MLPLRWIGRDFDLGQDETLESCGNLICLRVLLPEPFGSANMRSRGVGMLTNGNRATGFYLSRRVDVLHYLAAPIWENSVDDAFLRNEDTTACLHYLLPSSRKGDA